MEENKIMIACTNTEQISKNTFKLKFQKLYWDPKIKKYVPIIIKK